jgi:hypothetical protein
VYHFILALSYNPRRHHAPPVRDWEAYHACQGQDKRAPASPSASCAALTWHGSCDVSRTGQAGTRCGRGRRQNRQQELAHGRREKIRRGPLGRLQQGGPPFPTYEVAKAQASMKERYS